MSAVTPPGPKCYDASTQHEPMDDLLKRIIDAVNQHAAAMRQFREQVSGRLNTVSTAVSRLEGRVNHVEASLNDIQRAEQKRRDAQHRRAAEW